VRLYSRAWLRAVRTALARELRAHPALRRDSRRRLWGRSRTLPAWTFRAAVPLGFAMLGLRAGEPQTGLDALMLWALLPTLMRAQDWQNRLVQHQDAAAFVALPVGDDWLFRFHSAQVWRASLWLGADALALYAALAWRAAASPALILAYLGAAAAQWLAALGAATLLHRAWPRAPFGPFAALLWGLAFASCFLFQKAPGLFQSLFAGAVAALWPVTPAGWIHAALGGFHSGEAQIVFALPTLILIATLPWNWGALRARYRFREEAPDWTPLAIEEDEEASDSAGALGAAQIHAQSAAVALEAVESREWLRDGFAVRDGPLERLVQRWLSERERRVLDFLCAGAVGWTASWRRAWIAALICAATLTALRFVWPSAGLGFAFGLSAWLVASIAAPMWGGEWPGFSLVWIGQRGCAICSVMPLGYAEVSLVVLKTSTIRLAAALPIYAAFGAFGGWFFSASPGVGALLGGKVALLVMAFQPLSTIIPFSPGTNDSSSGCLGALAWFAALGVFLPLLGGAIFFTIASSLQGFLGVPAMAGVAWAGGRIYRAAYERGWFDLLTPIR
jgi:hypothetical protein